MKWEMKQKQEAQLRLLNWGRGKRNIRGPRNGFRNVAKARVAKDNLEAAKFKQLFGPIPTEDQGFNSPIFEKFKEIGLRRLGSGMFSSVWTHPDKSKVIKVIYRPATDPWCDYVRWANEQGYGGSFAPKLYSYKYSKAFGVGVAVMERLAATISDVRRDVNKTKNEIDKVKFIFRTAEMSIREENNYAASVVDGIQPGYGQFADNVLRTFKDKGSRFDLHDENWMVRNSGELVLTDPLCYGASKRYLERFKLN